MLGRNSKFFFTLGLLICHSILFISNLEARPASDFSLSSGACQIRVFQQSESSGFSVGYYLNNHIAALSGEEGDYLRIEHPESGNTYQGRISDVTTIPEGLLFTVEIPQIGLVYREQISPNTIDECPYFKSWIEVESDNYQELVIQRSFQIQSRRKPFFLVPGYFYGSNNIENASDAFPQLDYQGEIGIPKSSIFYFRSDRSSHSAVEAIFGRTLLAVSTQEGCRSSEQQEDFFYNGLGLDTSQASGNRLILTMGYKNYPARYNGNCPTRLAPRWEEQPELAGIRFQPNQRYVTQHLLYLAPAPDRFAFEKAQRVFYWNSRKKASPKASRDFAKQAISQALIEDSVIPESDLFRVIDRSEECDIGWTGGMMIAYPLWRAGHQLGDEQMQLVALQSIDSLCRNGFSEKSGLFFDAYRDHQWTTEGWWAHWSGGAHLAYTNGQALYYILRTYHQLPQDLKSTKSFWLERCRQVLETALREQKKSGEFPVAYDPENGKGLDRPGFAGCWFLPAMTEFYRITGERDFLRSARKAEKYYYQWLSTYELWGTPIDAANATDQEGNLALVIGCVNLHRATGDSNYLDHALHALNYDFSWKYAYRSQVSNEPLKSLAWDSTGGNTTSCCNIHAHQMGTLIAEENYYLYQNTHDIYLKERLNDTLVFSLGTFNRTDGEFGFGKKGWVTEQFFHTDAIQGEMPADGGIWSRYLPWAAASVLNGLVADIPDEWYD